MRTIYCVLTLDDNEEDTYDGICDSLVIEDFIEVKGSATLDALSLRQLRELKLIECDNNEDDDLDEFDEFFGDGIQETNELEDIILREFAERPDEVF